MQPNSNVPDEKMTPMDEVIEAVETHDVYPIYDTFCKCVILTIGLVLTLLAYGCCQTRHKVVQEGSACCPRPKRRRRLMVQTLRLIRYSQNIMKI